MATVGSENALHQLIAPEIIGDDFHTHIQALARQADVHTVLEIGSSSGEGSTAAFVAGLRDNPNRPMLFCLEVSQPRFAALRRRYAADSFVKCYNASTVAPHEFPTETEVSRFYHSTPTNLNSYPLDRVHGWLRQDVEYVRDADGLTDGIGFIQWTNGIDVFDMVLIDGSEFTGPSELAKVYGAKYLLLDDINSYKNYANHRRLLDDPSYELIAEDVAVRNGYAIFRRVLEEDEKCSVSGREWWGLQLDLSRTRQELQRVRHNQRELAERLRWMESSLFWKLRAGLAGLKLRLASVVRRTAGGAAAVCREGKRRAASSAGNAP